LPSGCRFHPRCPLFEEGLCDQLVPELKPIGQAGHQVACHVASRLEGTAL
jgi:ABC-type dipeptide/oligopeptide/nickel transport system ATPase component